MDETAWGKETRLSAKWRSPVALQLQMSAQRGRSPKGSWRVIERWSVVQWKTKKTDAVILHASVSDGRAGAMYADCPLYVAPGGREQAVGEHPVIER